MNKNLYALLNGLMGGMIVLTLLFLFVLLGEHLNKIISEQIISSISERLTPLATLKHFVVSGLVSLVAYYIFSRPLGFFQGMILGVCLGLLTLFFSPTWFLGWGLLGFGNYWGHSNLILNNLLRRLPSTPLLITYLVFHLIYGINLYLGDKILDLRRLRDG